MRLLFGPDSQFASTEPLARSAKGRVDQFAKPSAKAGLCAKPTAGVDVERSFRTGRRGRACATSYLVYELGPRGIRVQAISPSPLKTRAAVRLKDFELLPLKGTLRELSTLWTSVSPASSGDAAREAG
jgi:hypothetical protein